MDPSSDQKRDAPVSRENDDDDQESTPRTTYITTNDEESDSSLIENGKTLLAKEKKSDFSLIESGKTLLAKEKKSELDNIEELMKALVTEKLKEIYLEGDKHLYKYIMSELDNIELEPIVTEKLILSFSENLKFPENLKNIKNQPKQYNKIDSVQSIRKRGILFPEKPDEVFDFPRFEAALHVPAEHRSLDADGNIKNEKNYSLLKEVRSGFQNNAQIRCTSVPNQPTRKFYHTILCIDTSKSMRSSKQMTCCCIQELIREIPEQNIEFEEIISVVCFGKKIRSHKYNPDNHTRHIQFLNKELQDQSWIGCTPLADACFECISLHNCVKAELRQAYASLTLKGRVVMFTDGKCNSNRLRENEDEDVHNPSESMQDINTYMNELWTIFRAENLPIFCIISSYRYTDQNFLVTMAICTNGKVILRDEISTFAKFIEIEITAEKLSNHCRGFNWHQVFAYLRIKLGHKENLYFDYTTERILREHGVDTLNFCNNNCLPRLTRRFPKQGIYGWQEQNPEWVFFSNEISDEIEKAYSACEHRQLETFTVERENGHQQIDVLRFDLTSMSYRVIGKDGNIYVRRYFIGNDWG